MPATISEMTREELRELIEESIEHKLFEMMQDPDRGLILKKDVRERLRRSFAAEERGERGITSEELEGRVRIRR